MKTKILFAGIAIIAFAAVSFKSLNGDNVGRTEEYVIVNVTGEGKKAVSVSRETENPSVTFSKDSDDLLKTLGDLNKEGFELIDSNSAPEIKSAGSMLFSVKNQTFIFRKKLK